MAFRPTTTFTSTFTAFPYLTGSLPTWPVPANVSNEAKGAYLLGPDENVQSVIDQHRVIVLQGDEVYRWKRVVINKPTTIAGNGATVILDGDGPCIIIDGGRGFPGEIPVIISDVCFQGTLQLINRDQPMDIGCLSSSAIWVKNALQVTIFSCIFEKFAGAALWFDADDTNWDNRNFAFCHYVSENLFRDCRLGIAIGNNVQYGLSSNNVFYDCHIAFYMIGTNWGIYGNSVLSCRCAYFHSKENMWYSGAAANNGITYGSVVGNFFSNANLIGLQWHENFVAMDGRGIKLQGFYFDDDGAVPPTWTGNTHYWSGIDLLNFDSNMQAYVFTGCTFMGKTASVESAGRLNIADAIKAKTFFSGCSGNGVHVYGVESTNLFPPNFATVKSGSAP